MIFGLEEKPSRKDFLLINVSYEKALNPKLDEFGFSIGNEAITNRESLAKLFEKTSAFNNHTYIVCDVFLEQSSPADSLLLQNVQRTSNIVFPFHAVEGVMTMPVIKVPTAFSDYDSDFGNFLKYKFIQYDTCSTIALKMYKDIHHASYTSGLLFDRKNDHRALKSFIIEFPIRQYDIFRDDTLGYHSFHLGNLLELPDPLLRDILKDKIIVVGDFLEEDLHQTIYGTTAGPLIHLNAYLNLRDNKNNLSGWFFLYLFSCYLLFSYVLIRNVSLVHLRVIQWIQKSKAGSFIFDYLKYAFFLLIMSIVSYLVFGIHLNILIMSLYFSLAEYVIEYIDSKRKLKLSHP